MARRSNFRIRTSRVSRALLHSALKSAVATTILGPAFLHAATQTYDTSNVTNTWNTTTANWDNSVVWTNGNAASFSQIPGEVIGLNGSVSTSGITDDDGANTQINTISGGLTLTAGTIAVTGLGTQLSLSSAPTVIDGTLIKSGDGILKLSGTNHSYNLTINRGIVQAYGGSAGVQMFTAGKTITVNAGGILDTTTQSLGGGPSSTLNASLVLNTDGRWNANAEQYIQSLTIGNGAYITGRNTDAIRIPSTGATFAVNATNASSYIYAGMQVTGSTTITVANGTADTDLLIDGQLSGSNAFSKSGTGKMVLTGTNSASTSPLTISSGTLQVGNFGTTGTLTSGSVSVLVGGTLAFNRSDSIVVANAISGGGSLNIAGRGVVTLSATNSLTGTTTIDSNGMRLFGGLGLDYTANNTSKIATAVPLIINSGRVLMTGNASAATSQTVAALNLNGAGTLEVNPGAGQTATLALISTTRAIGGTLNVRSSGTLGTTALVTGTGIGTTAVGWATVNDVANGDNFAKTDGSGNVVGAGFTHTNNLTGGSTSNVLINAATTMLGNQTINTLTAQADVIQNSGEVLTINTGGIIGRTNSILFKSSAGDGVTNRGAITSGMSTGELFVHSTTSFDSGATGITIRSDIVNPVGPLLKLVKDGIGNLTMTDNHSYTGGTWINEGRITMNSATAALGSGSITINSGGQLYITGIGANFTNSFNIKGYGAAQANGTYGAIRFGSNAGLTGAITLNGNTRISADPGVTARINTGGITGSNDLEIGQGSGSGLGWVILGNNPNFTGRLIASGSNGGIRLSNDLSMGAVPASYRPDNIIGNGGYLQAGTTDGTNGIDLTIAANRGITLMNGTTTSLQTWGGFTMTVASPIVGLGSIQKTDGGTALFSGVNTYSGDTFMNQGTLTVSGSVTNSNSVRFNGTSAMNVNAGASVTLRNYLVGGDANAAVSTLTVNGTLNNVGTTNNPVGSDMANVFGRVAFGTTTVNLNAGGAMNLVGAPLYLSFDGQAIVNQTGGTANLLGMEVGYAGKTNLATWNFTGGNLNIGNAGITAGSNTNKNLNLGGGTLGANESWMASATMQFTNTGGATNVNPGTGKSINFNGSLQGAGGFTKNGAGTVVVNSASNTFAGGVVANAGNLVASKANALGTGDVTIQSTANVFASANDALGTGDVNINSATGILTIGAGVGFDAGSISGGSMNTATANPKNLGIQGATYLLNSNYNWGSNTTYCYSGQVFNKTGANITLTFAESIDDGAYLKIDSTVLLNDTSFNTPTKGTISLTPGAHTIEIRGFNAGSIGGPNTSTSGGWTNPLLGLGVDYGGNNDISTYRFSPIRDTSSVAFRTTAKSVSIANTINLNVAASTIEVNSGDVGTLLGTVQGTGGLKKTGAGELVLAGPNTYGGATNIAAGQLTISGSHLADHAGYTVADGATLLVASGGVINSPTTPSFLTINNSGSAIVDGGDATFNKVVGTNLTLQNNGLLTLALSVPGSPASAVSNLNIDSSSRLDLTNNLLVVQTPGALSSVWGMIFTGMNGFDGNGQTTWDGPGIVSSEARNQNLAVAVDALTVGAIRNGDMDVLNGPGSAYTTFGGVAVGAEDILVRYTYAGDTNLDGTVTIDDYNSIDGTVLGLVPNLGWISGDFDLNGTITIDDYNAIDTGFLYEGGQLSQSLLSMREVQFGAAYVQHLEAVAAAFGTVPEPSSLCLGVVCTFGRLSRRQRRGDRR